MKEPSQDAWQGGELASALIASGRRERANPTAQRAAALAITSFASASHAGWVTVVKWLGISAVVAGGGATTLNALLHGASTPVVASQAPVSSRPQLLTALASAAPSVEATPPPPSARESKRRSAVAPALPSAKPAPRDERLRQELATLREARSALARGNGAGALALLDTNTQGFQLLPIEAGIVRVQALRASGNVAAAKSLATRLSQTHGAGPYAERLKALASD